MANKTVLRRLWEDRPNYKIVHLTKFVDRLDAEKLLNSLPIKFKLNVLDEAGSVPLLEVSVWGPTVEIFPPYGQEIRGIFLDQEGGGAEATRKIWVKVITCEIEGVVTHYVPNELSTINVKPVNVGCIRWVGLYDFQREHSAHEEVEFLIYKRPRGDRHKMTWEEIKEW